MPREGTDSTEAVARALPVASHGPHYRAVLEARWQAMLGEVTELSLAYHAVAGDSAARGGPGGEEARRLLCRTIAARRKLADVEEALGRLSSGSFGRCEQCGRLIPPGLLAVSPEQRYCPRCITLDAPAPALAGHPLS
jgi:DnaK suppressor protein